MDYLFIGGDYCGERLAVESRLDYVDLRRKLSGVITMGKTIQRYVKTGATDERGNPGEVFVMNELTPDEASYLWRKYQK